MIDFQITLQDKITTSEGNVGKVRSIHYLRGMAALLVVFFHFRFYLNGVYAQKDLGTLLFGGGAFGVDLFFIISGFIIAMSTEKKSSPLIFVVRRFFRIYPAFILTFLVGVIFIYYNLPTESIVRAMFFIHKDYGLDSPSFGYNVLGPAWTLTYEFYFYFTFVIAMSISHSYRVLISSLLIIIPMFIIQILYTGNLDLSGTGSPSIPAETTLYGVIRFISSPIMIEFIIGMGLYFIFKKSSTPERFRVLSTPILYTSIGVFLTLYFQNKYYGFGLQGFAIWAFALIVGSLFFEKYNNIKENKALSFLGDISYSLYLTHYVVISAFDLYHPAIWSNISGLSKFFLATTSCLIVAYITFNFVEKPFIKVGKLIECSINKKSFK